MKNITIETNFVRVIGNATSPNIKKMNEMVGQEYEVSTSDYDDDTICVWNKDKSDSWYFNKKDVRFLTAGMHNKRSIAIDDDVLVDDEWQKVCGFYVFDKEVKMLTGTPEDTMFYDMLEIKDHRTGAPSLSGTQVTVTIGGKDYPATVN